MNARPQHYFLNERHQLAPTEKDGGGKNTPVVNINWKSHGTELSGNLRIIRAARQSSIDPTSKNRLFIVAKASTSVEKLSDAKSAQGKPVIKDINLAGGDSQVIRRLGFDLVATTKEGHAVVHATDERIEQMSQSLNRLSELSMRDKNKWSQISRFDEVPLNYKTDISWWKKVADHELLESIIDFQPFLSSSEIEKLIKAVTARLQNGERLKRLGSEFTGRKWALAQLRRKTIVELAMTFQAIFSIHPPLLAVAIMAKRVTAKRSTSSSSAIHHAPPNARILPCVGVIDTGIPAAHILLGPYRRGGIAGEGTDPTFHDAHGSKVASRVVFGEVECDDHGTPVNLLGRCSIYDINVADINVYGDRPTIHSESIDGVVNTIVANAPDIRVFNISLDSVESIDSYDGSLKDAWLRRIAELDNRSFSQDILFVVAAGNSDPGIIPTPPYPYHYEAEEWRLRAWSRCFNALTCGGTADTPNPDGVAAEPGAPSPFCRSGPGFANSRKPDLSAHAGNCGEDYRYPLSGVWCCDHDGNWDQDVGTSLAAPLIAREAARTFSFLASKCEGNSRPFAALVKAVLALHAKRAALSESLKKLADHTIGLGHVTLEDITSLNRNKATFFWQGIIPSEADLLTVELPLPGDWIANAQKPIMRIVCAWDTPVNPAAPDVWACRQVELTLRSSGGDAALRFKHKNPIGYPLVERRYEFDGPERVKLSNQDNCLLELRYKHQGMAEYPAGLLDISPQQRVGIAYELFDENEVPTSPHEAIQALPVAAQGTLNRLSSVVPSSRHAISVRIAS